MKVSVVTPSFNQAQFIERTLKSVSTQDGAQIEHYVCDGGSSDGTVDVLRRWKPEVRWVSEKDKGQADAVNKGIAATDGDIIGWLNSDDVYYPGAIERVVAYFTEHPDVDVVYGLADHIDVDDRPFEAYPTEPWDGERLKETCFLCQPAVFFRRRVVSSHGALDQRLQYCMDYEYWLRLAGAGARFGFLQEKLAGSRMYAANKTLGARRAVHAEINDMMKRTLGRVPDRWLFNYAHAEVESRVNRADRPRWFVINVSMVSLLAALRWNHGISSDMLGKAAAWAFR
jgi:glycosyltransferase involved in cell wall biosynthesis